MQCTVPTKSKNERIVELTKPFIIAILAYFSVWYNVRCRLLFYVTRPGQLLIFITKV